LPVAYSQGFNRRPRLSLAAPLPLGYTSEAELADFWLADPMTLDAASGWLRATLPPGLALRALEEVSLSAPSLQQQLAESTYRITFLDPVDPLRLRMEVERLLGADSLMRTRRKEKKPQPYDLRPLILNLSVSEGIEQGPVLSARLQQSPGRFGRPDELLLEMGIDPFDARVHRVMIGLADEAELSGDGPADEETEIG
jgi:radical SAM-linked protein